jgi:hypothetical protein
MHTLEHIIKLATAVQQSGDYDTADLLRKVALDVGLVETNRYFIKQFKTAQKQIKEMQEQLVESCLYRSAEDLDVIARDLQEQIIAFQASDPLEAVLDSYKLLHKIAKVDSSPTLMQEIASLVDDESLSDQEILKQIQALTMGLPLHDKQNIAYILEKDYNFSLPFEKIAKLEEQKEETEKEKEQNRKKIKELLEEYHSLPEEERVNFKIPASFPSQPHMWGGFAYQTTIPYNQNSILNFWSLASSKEADILKKIAKY